MLVKCPSVHNGAIELNLTDMAKPSVERGRKKITTTTADDGVARSMIYNLKR